MNPMNNNPLNSHQSGIPMQQHIVHGGINQHHMGVISQQGMIPTHMVNIQQIQSQPQMPQQQLQQQLQQQHQKQQIPTQQQVLPPQQLLAQQQHIPNQQQISSQQPQLQQNQIQITSQQQLIQQENMIQQMNSPLKQVTNETVNLDQTDPVFRAKLLLPRLKEVYKKLVSDSALVLKDNLSADMGNSSTESSTNSFESSFETFNEILDIMECHLHLACDTLAVNKESFKYAPSSVQVYSKDSSIADSITYPQYLTLCKAQINFAAEIKDILSRGMNKIAEHSSLPPTVD